MAAVAKLGERMTGERAPLLLPVADLSTLPERMQEAVSAMLDLAGEPIAEAR